MPSHSGILNIQQQKRESKNMSESEIAIGLFVVVYTVVSIILILKARNSW